jgi:hypothetical protein
VDCCGQSQFNSVLSYLLYVFAACTPALCVVQMQISVVVLAPGVRIVLLLSLEMTIVWLTTSFVFRRYQLPYAGDVSFAFFVLIIAFYCIITIVVSYELETLSRRNFWQMKLLTDTNTGLNFELNPFSEANLVQWFRDSRSEAPGSMPVAQPEARVSLHTKSESVASRWNIPFEELDLGPKLAAVRCLCPAGAVATMAAAHQRQACAQSDWCVLCGAGRRRHYQEGTVCASRPLSTTTAVFCD